MITPAILLMLLTGPWLAVRLLARIGGRMYSADRAAVIGLALLFAYAGIGHFAVTGPMSQMLPPWMPYRVPLVYATGVLELVIAAGLLVRRTALPVGIATVIVLLLFFPANIYAALNHVPMGGHAWGPVYLLIRAPLQLFILAWVYWFVLRPARVARLPAGAEAPPRGST